jgi:hypothetical protein
LPSCYAAKYDNLQEGNKKMHMPKEMYMEKEKKFQVKDIGLRKSSAK